MKNNKKYFIVILISILVLSLGGCAVNDNENNDVINNGNEIKENNNNNDNETINNNDGNKTEDYVNENKEIKDTSNDTSNGNIDNKDTSSNINNNENANKWMDYILGTNISSIKLKYCIYDELGVDEPVQEIIDITKNDLNRIFTEMKKGTISKSYYGGYGGPCTSSINIEYSTANIQTELKLVYFKLLDFNSTKDNKVISYLESANYTIKKYMDDIDLETEPCTFEYTYNNSIIDIIYNEYKN